MSPGEPLLITIPSTLVYLLAIFLTFIPCIAMGQDGQSAGNTPEDQELARLKKEKEKAGLEKEIAEARKAKADAERATLDAQLPKPETKPLEGKTTVDEKVVIEAQILAYQAMGKIAEAISKEVADTLPKSDSQALIFYSERDIPFLLQYQAIDQQITWLTSRYEEVLQNKVSMPVPLLLIPALAGTLMKSIIDVAALFRTNVEVKGAAVQIDEVALVAEIARRVNKLRESKHPIQIVYPAIYLPSLIQTSPLVQKLTRLSTLKQEGDKTITDYEKQSSDEKNKEPIKSKLPQLKALGEQFDKLASSLLTRDDKTGLNPLTALLKVEKLHEKLPTAHILYVKVLASGGSNMTRQNLLSSKLLHSGGSVIAYLLFDHQGSILSSKTSHAYEGYHEITDKVDNLN